MRFNDNVPLDLRVEFGAGEGRLNLGSLSLRSVEFEMGAGTLSLDLRGTPSKDYSVRVRGGVGEATVYLPKEIGISATASGGIGDISVTGLRKSGDRYVNDAYERAAVRIRLDVQGGVGSIKLITRGRCTDASCLMITAARSPAGMPCSIRCSSKVWPIVRTGFNAVNGSCGIKAMRRPSSARGKADRKFLL